MFWYSLLAVLAVLFVLSVALPVPRRIWAFSLITTMFFFLWLSDVLFLRRLWFAITGRSARYQKLTRPALLRMFCEDLGPTFIKFGQIIASSAALFPDAYVKEFQKVLDRVKPFPFEDVKRTLDEELGAEKAAHLIDIEPKQLASASIAQVHTATLDDGTKVVIKVQRLGIAARTAAVMKILRFMAGIVARLKRGDETKMWVFANRLPKDHLLIAPRGINPAPGGGYAWHTNPNRSAPRLEDFRPAVDRLSSLFNHSVLSSGDLSCINITGFSEGAALAYPYGMLRPLNIHAIAGLSGFLPVDAITCIDRRPLAGKNIFITHGTRDKLVPVFKARLAAELLEAAGASVTYCEDDVGHKLSAGCFRGLGAIYAQLSR